jgi:hypothetical protein
VDADGWSRAWKQLSPTLAFLACVLLLDAVTNARYPAPEARFWYLLPSLDVSVLLLGLALLGRRGLSLPAGIRVGVVVLLVFVRVLRFADGVELVREPGARFELSIEARLLPEFVRLMHSTLAPARFWVGAAGLMVGLGALGFLLNAALRYSEKYLRSKRHAVGLLAGLAGCVVVSLFAGTSDYRLGAFGRSVVPRLLGEARSSVMLHVRERAQISRIERVQNEWRHGPQNLARLRGANVFLFLVEAYGKAAFDVPDFRARLDPVYERLERDLGKSGYAIASGFIEAPTYGGRSWLSHATLATGIRTTDELEYRLVLAQKPRTIAHFFGAAGYRTVLVQPNTTRPWPAGDFYGFDKKYYAWDFEYRGPRFAWAEMPDQFSIDYVRRRELDRASRPMFIEYVLVTSHAPWAELPKVVENWDDLGDGSIYSRLGMDRFPVGWNDLATAGPAYSSSLVYDLEVLRRYFSEHVRDRALVIVMGDHQPLADVAAQSRERAVPVHVLSRDPELVRPFLARGYTPGMRPKASPPYAAMDEFLSAFRRDFSSEQAR